MSVFLAVSDLLETILSIIAPCACVWLSYRDITRKDPATAYWWLGLAALLLAVKK
jgi:hypothetical protein